MPGGFEGQASQWGQQGLKEAARHCLAVARHEAGSAAIVPGAWELPLVFKCGNGSER